MTSVSFPFYPKPDGTWMNGEFRYTVKAVADLEKAAGMDVALMRAGIGRVRTLILFLCYGQRYRDDALTEKKAEQQLQRFIDKGGDVAKLTEALVDALNKSGVLGKDDEPPSADDVEEENPTEATAETT